MAAPSYQERFLAYYKDEIRNPLTDKEKEVLERWRQINALLRKGKPRPTIVAIIRKEFQVSEATVYNDIRDAMAFFGSFEKPHKEFLRSVLYDLALETLNKARTKDDLKAEAMAMANLIKISGVDRESPDIPDFSKFEGNKYMLTIVIGDQTHILNLEKPGEIPADIMQQLEKALRAPNLSKQEMLRMLDEPEQEPEQEAEAEDVT